MPGRASGIKMVGIVEMGAPSSLEGWQSIRTVGVAACVIFISHQKIQKTAICTFWYQLIRDVPDKVQRAEKWLCVCVCVRRRERPPLLLSPSLPFSALYLSFRVLPFHLHPFTLSLYELPQRGAGRRTGRKRVLMHFEPKNYARRQRVGISFSRSYQRSHFTATFSFFTK